MYKKELNSIIPLERIEKIIYVIRGRKIILDQDLATLYGVQTKNLNKAVNRNRKRFPEDFIFQLTKVEWESLRFQFGTSNNTYLKSQIVISKGRGGRRTMPYAFTEHGVAMISNLLKSERAIAISVEIVRAFIRMRQILKGQNENNKLSELVSFLLKHSNQNDKEFRRVWNAIEKLSQPINQRKIGFDLSDNG